MREDKDLGGDTLELLCMLLVVILVHFISSLIYSVASKQKTD